MHEGDAQFAIDVMEGTLRTFKMKINKKYLKILVCARKRQNIVDETWSIALYGCENWIETQRNSLDILEMWCWRRMQEN